LTGPLLFWLLKHASHCVKSPKQDTLAPEDIDDLDDPPELGAIPDDTEVEEGNEEKDDGTNLPPAMPPAV
jgi:hypothetical protein